MSQRFEGLLRRLGIERGEAGLMAVATGCLAAVGWADVSLANVAETYFLKRVGVEYLPIAFLASSVLMVGTSYALGRLTAVVDRTRLLPIVFGVLAVLLMGLYVVVELEVPGAITSLILISKQFKITSLLVFWVVMGDLLHGRQAKRLFGPLTAGLTLGSIGGSFASGAVGQTFGLASVLAMTAAAMVVGGLFAARLPQTRRIRLERGLAAAPPEDLDPPAVAEPGGGLLSMWGESRLFRLLLLMVVLGALLGPMLHYEFSYVVDAATSGEDGEASLLALYAKVRGGLNAAILFAQLVLASSLFRLIGVPRSAGLTAFVFLAAFLGLGVSLTLPVAIGAVVATRLQGQAIYTPAMKVLFNLLPDGIRARAMAFLEGPLERFGGALGNVLVLAALQLGSVVWVSVAAAPIALAWLVVATMLWRAYPALLLAAAARGESAVAEPRDVEELVDRNTLRVLAEELADSDPTRCQAAIELVRDANPEMALEALSRALLLAPPTTRPLLVAGLDDLLERPIDDPLTNREVAQRLVDLLEERSDLSQAERVDLVQAGGRLTERIDDVTHIVEALRTALDDEFPAVALAARAALFRRSWSETGAFELDQAIEAALDGSDRIERRTAREELRWLLLYGEVDETWRARAARLAQLLEDPREREAAAQGLSDVSLRHGRELEFVADQVLQYRRDPSPGVRAALIRFAGRCGREEVAPWMIESLGSGDAALAEAAHEGLLSLGPRVAHELLVAHTFGRRSTRGAILSIVRDLEVDQDGLRDTYRGEIARLRGGQIALFAAQREADAEDPKQALLLQRLAERLEEGIRAALLLLSVLRDDDRIAELEEGLRHSRGQRRHGILIEALEALLAPAERNDLLPILEDAPLEQRVRRLAADGGVRIPTLAELVTALSANADPLTRRIAQAQVDGAGDIEDHPEVSTAVEIALLLKQVPLFERLSTGNLMNLADVLHDEHLESGAVVCREGEVGDCMYLIAQGSVRVSTGETQLADLGPGAFFGEMALFDGVERSASVSCLTPVRLLQLDRADLMRLMEDLPPIAIGLCQALSRRVRDMNARV